MASRLAYRDIGIALLGVGVIAFLAVGRGGAPNRQADARPAVRLAYFPNLTHAPALIGVAEGLFERELSGCRLETKVVNAGPEAMEALLAGQIDFAYVGPSPAVNTFAKTGGNAVRILAGACEGGASLIRRKDVSIGSVRELDGRRIAVPQLGGTQDVSCRKFLASNGLKPKERGGSVEIIPIKNPDILLLFRQRQLDAAWVPEPWAARIKDQTGAVTVVDERDLWPDRRFATTVLVVRKAFADGHPEIVEAMCRANEAAIALIHEHPDEAKSVANDELKRLTGKPLPRKVFEEAWGRLRFSSEPDRKSIRAFADAAVEAGYLKEVPPRLDTIYSSVPGPRVP